MVNESLTQTRMPFILREKSQVTQGVLELVNCLPLGLYSLVPTGLAYFNTFEVMFFKKMIRMFQNVQNGTC